MLMKLLFSIAQIFIRNPKVLLLYRATLTLKRFERILLKYISVWIRISSFIHNTRFLAYLHSLSWSYC